MATRIFFSHSSAVFTTKHAPTSFSVPSYKVPFTSLALSQFSALRFRPASLGGPRRVFTAPRYPQFTDEFGTVVFEGCDYEHWHVIMEDPDENMTRDQIIDMYIKTLAQVVGSEEEARMKIYMVSTKHYFGFGALVDEETSYRIEELPKVRFVLPDSYLDAKNKDYGGEPFINGEALPYDPKYHERWARKNPKGLMFGRK